MTTSHPQPTGTSWLFARGTAPMARTLAGRRFIPLWAVVHHVGRKSGRQLSVPVAVQASPEAFVIALPWGAGTNWARNVLAADGCVVRWKGAEHRVDQPRLLGPQEARPYFSRVAWFAVEHVIHGEAFLLLHRVN